MPKKKTFKTLVGQHVVSVEGTSYKIKELPDIQFFFYKDNVWHLVEVTTGLEAFNGKTQKEVKEKIKSFLTNFSVDHIRKSVESADTLEVAEAKFKSFQENRDKFQNIFGFPAPICPITGKLDVIKLDDLLKPTEGISLFDFITQKYGKKAAQLVESMI